MRLRLSGPHKELVVVAAGQLLAAVGLLAGLRIVTSYLNRDEYGSVALALTVGILVNQVAFGPFVAAFARFFPSARESAKLDVFFAGVYRMTRSLVVPGLAIIAVVGVVAIASGSGVVALLLPSLCFALLSGLEQTLDGLQNAARRRAVVAWHLALGGVLRAILPLVLFQWVEPSGASLLWIYVLCTLLVLTSQSLYFRQGLLLPVKGAVPPRRTEVQVLTAQMRRFGGPFALWGVATWLYFASDRWALNLSAGLEQVGLYNVAYQLGNYPIALLTAILMQMMVPLIYGMAGDATDPDRLRRTSYLTRKVALIVAGASVVVASGAAFAADLVFAIAVAPAFRSGSVYMGPIMLAAGLFTAGQVASLRPMLEMETGRLLAPKLVTSAIGVALNIVGALLWGIGGVVAAGVLFSTGYLAWVLSIREPRATMFAEPRPGVEPITPLVAGPPVPRAHPVRGDE